MIINNYVQSITGAYAVNRTEAARRTQQSGEVTEYDRFVPSKEGQDFRAMLQELKDTDEVRINKVEYFENAIKNGTYNVASENVAAAMLASRF